jgi:hypothetical protein
MSDTNLDIDRCAAEGPETALEKQLVADFLLEKGYRMEDLHKLPAEQVTALMTEACRYASLKLAEIEAKSVFRKEIHSPF